MASRVNHARRRSSKPEIAMAGVLELWLRSRAYCPCRISEMKSANRSSTSARVRRSVL